MSKFGDLIRGIKAEPAPEPTPAPVPEPVVEEVVEEAPVLEEMSKKELEEYGRTIGY